ncbi:MAG: siroheme synthase CysG [Azospirillaceae bacterium]|nr:siroheme synthase CysG [Azospirillaceae bacterium]
MTAPFPLFLTLTGQTVLIVGGGELALRKARLVAGQAGTDGRGARLVVVAPDVQPDLAALAQEVRHRPFADSDLDGVTLVFAAGEDDVEAARVAALARARGLLVNVPDRPALSSFIMPAIIDRAPVTVAISTGGASPVLARRLRARLEAALEPGLGRLAFFLDGFRTAVRAVKTDETARRRFWERVIDGPIARRFLAGDEAGAHEQLVKALNASGEGAIEGGSVALVGAGPGDPDLLTLRALRVLQDADVVVHDKLVDERILDYVRRDARRIYVGKSKSCHTLSQGEINALLVREAQAGHRVVRLKGGDPFIFGRGGEEMVVLRAAGIPVELVPGITAAVGCAAATGIPLTHRGLAQGITVITAHGAGPAGEGAEPPLDWPALARLDHTLAIYMGLSKAGLVAERLIAAGKAPGTPAALVENGTRPDQVLAVGTLAQLGELAVRHALKGPALILVGEVVSLADPAQIAADVFAQTTPTSGRFGDTTPGAGFKAAV